MLTSIIAICVVLAPLIVLGRLILAEPPRIQFSLRTLLFTTTFLAIILGLLAYFVSR